MLNSISRLGETTCRPEKEWSNGTEFSGFSDYPEFRPTSRGTLKISE